MLLINQNSHDVIMKLLNRIQFGGDHECWVTKKYKGDNYPYFAFGKRFYLHRMFYEKYNGPIPKGMLIRHTCDNQSCVNPNHLKIGTDQDNASDAKLRGRTRMKEDFCHRGHAFTPQNTRFDKNGWRHCRTCHNIRNREYCYRKKNK